MRKNLALAILAITGVNTQDVFTTPNEASSDFT